MYLHTLSSTCVSSQPGTLEKVIVASHSTGTFALYDGTLTVSDCDNAGTLVGTYTPATGSSVIEFEPLGFDTGLFINTNGDIDLTVIYNQNPNPDSNIHHNTRSANSYPRV